MRNIISINRIIITGLLSLILWPGLTLAQDNPNDLEHFKQQLQQMQQRMDDMQRDHQAALEAMKKQHAEEIKSLHGNIRRLESQVQPPTPKPEEDELEALRALAQELAGEEEQKKSPEETVFKFGGLSLQKLNPELSITGNFTWSYQDPPLDRKRAEFDFQALELNVQSYLDPFSRFSATVPITADGAEVEEAYYTRFALLENLNITLGKFRQQFGVVNRWHEDGLDQVEHPLPIKRIFGEEGLAQTGLSLDFNLPPWYGGYQALTLQITNSENDRLFEQETEGVPSFLFHYKNYRDLSRDTYLEWGLSGLFGWNDTWQVQRGTTLAEVEDTLATQVLGVDLSLLWEPADRALYRNIEWRSELFFLNRDLQAPDDSGVDTIRAWGAYSYVQSKISRSFIVGVRADLFVPDDKYYADPSLMPLAESAAHPYRWQLAPYLTWDQSEFVRFRVEFDHADGHGDEDVEDIFWGQLLFAVGPHKHERY